MPRWVGAAQARLNHTDSSRVLCSYTQRIAVMLLVIAGGRVRCLGLERDAGQIEQDCQSDSREEGRLEGAAWVSSEGGLMQVPRKPGI